MKAEKYTNKVPRFSNYIPSRNRSCYVHSLNLKPLQSASSLEHESVNECQQPRSVVAKLIEKSSSPARKKGKL